MISNGDNMLKVLLLDNNLKDARVLITTIHNLDINVSVIHCTDKDDAFTKATSGHINIFILNIDTNFKDGYAFAKKIRNSKTYEMSFIICISSDISVFDSAYRELHCYDCFVKPLDIHKFLSSFLKLSKYKIIVANPYIKLPVNGIAKQIYIKDIVLAETLGRDIFVYLSNKLKITISSYKYSLVSLKDELGEDFIRIHKSYLVNKAYIESFKNNKVYIKGFATPFTVGRAYLFNIHS